MTVQSDNIKAMAILDSIKGCKVQDDNGKIYSVADVKCFNGQCMPLVSKMIKMLSSTRHAIIIWKWPMLPDIKVSYLQMSPIV